MSTPAQQLPLGTAPAMNTEEIRAFVQSIIGTQNVDSQVQRLMTENFEYREKNRVMRAELDAAKGRIPAEGAVVLTGDDVKLFNDFKALNLKPAEVTTLQTEFKALQGEVTTAKRKDSIATAAHAEGYDPTVLGTLIGDQELVVKPVTEDVDGKNQAVDRAFIRTKGADNTVTETRLSEHIEKNHAKFIPSLTVGEGDAGSTGSTNGTEFPRQRASAKSGKPAEASAAKDYLKKRYSSVAGQPAAK